jgi:hypothetical protein
LARGDPHGLFEDALEMVGAQLDLDAQFGQGRRLPDPHFDEPNGPAHLFKPVVGGRILGAATAAGPETRAFGKLREIEKKSPLPAGTAARTGGAAKNPRGKDGVHESAIPAGVSG